MRCDFALCWDPASLSLLCWRCRSIAVHASVIDVLKDAYDVAGLGEVIDGERVEEGRSRGAGDTSRRAGLEIKDTRR